MYVRIRIVFKYKGKIETEDSFVGPFIHPTSSDHWKKEFEKLDVKKEFSLEFANDYPNGAQRYNPFALEPSVLYEFLSKDLRTLERMEAEGTTP